MANMVLTRDDFMDYCMRKLGAPVIQINVDQDQVEDRIDDALQMYFEWHSDGSEKTFMAYQLQADDLTNQYISLDDTIIEVRKVFPFGGLTGTSLSNLQYMSFIQNVYDAQRISQGKGLVNLVINDMYTSTINDLFNYSKTVRFNRNTSRLYIETDWSNLKQGDYIMIEATQIVDPIDYIKVWNDMWLKKYATALIKRQWGENLIKYNGFQLPSGISLDGRGLYDDAVNEIKELEDELKSTWQEPPMFFMG